MSNPSRKIKPVTKARWTVRTVLLLGCVLPSAFSVSCKTAGLVNALDKDSRAFFSQVRYIISREEEKTFLGLPPAERGTFIEAFWKRRDPDPGTENNEFKDEYLGRIAAANKLFRGGGKEGFIQDRGRILVLLGPPNERDTEPVGRYSGARAYETWTYMIPYQIRLSFVDFSGDGEYTLVRPDTRALQLINNAQTRLQSAEMSGADRYDFSAEVKQEDTVFLLIRVPSWNAWLKETGQAASEHRLAVDLTILDPSGQAVWRHQKEYAISSHDPSITIPLDLKKGSYHAYLTLDDARAKNPQHKTWTFAIE